MRRKIVAGNWKMNNDLAQTTHLISELLGHMPQTHAEVMIAPAFTNLYHAFEALRESHIEVIAQNIHHKDSGAYTGEVSAAMLKSVGIETVITGHSERRAYFNEDDALLAEKTTAALQHHMDVIFCFGEALGDRKAGDHFNLVEGQLKNALFQFSAENWQHIILAYEPVWAIGTGETATPEQVQEMHRFIRKTIAEKYGTEMAGNVTILYGGSVKPANAREIFARPDVDGGLIGGASLKAEDFMAIVKAI